MKTHSEFINMVLSNQMHLSFSSLTALMKSPRHFYQYHTKEDEKTEAMIIGSLAHCLILQPEMFGEWYAVKPENANKASNANKAVLQAFEEQTIGKIAVSASMYSKAKIMADAVHNDPTAESLLYGEKEKPFELEYDGVRLKGIRDVYSEFAGTTDLKTTDNAHPKKFARKAIWDFFYYLQARIYTLNDDTSYSILAVDAGGFTSILNFSNEAIEAGGLLLSKLVYHYKLLQEQTAQNEKVWQQGYSYWYPNGYTVQM